MCQNPRDRELSKISNTHPPWLVRVAPAYAEETPFGGWPIARPAEQVMQTDIDHGIGTGVHAGYPAQGPPRAPPRRPPRRPPPPPRWRCGDPEATASPHCSAPRRRTTRHPRPIPELLLLPTPPSGAAPVADKHGGGYGGATSACSSAELAGAAYAPATRLTRRRRAGELQGTATTSQRCSGCRG
jgi:hypothetical protein